MEKMEPGIPQTALSAIKAGNKVEAVKLTRQELNLTLAEALQRVDNCLATSSDVEAAYLQNRRRVTPWLAIIMLAGAILVVVGLSGKLFALT